MTDPSTDSEPSAATPGLAEQKNVRSDSPVPFILPLALFLVISHFFYPDFAGSYQGSWGEEVTDAVTPETWQYMWVVGFQVLIAVGLVVYFRNVYLQHFPLKVSWVSVVVGVVGVLLWVGLCGLGVEPKVLGLLGVDHVRPSFNPFESIKEQTARGIFLAFRFSLLVVMVPIIEELFLRGWLVRYIDDLKWEHVSLSNLSGNALLAASVYGVLTHPGEAIAAFVWFGLVSWLMHRTGNLWDCVVAHAVTNLLLGIYVIVFSAWHLW